MSLTDADLVAGVMLVSLIAYSLFGGADFGAGFWDLVALGPSGKAQRSLIAKALGPVWEANHVWLIIVVVLLFTGFPPAFSIVMTTLHIPLSLMLIGIVLRGSAFTFRTYDQQKKGKALWSRIFSIPSVATPILLGIIIGAIASGEPGRAATQPEQVTLFGTWLLPFPILVGLFTLNIFAFIASVYLILESDEPEFREVFRRKALISAVTLGILAWVVYLLARTAAVEVFQGLHASTWGLLVRCATGLFAVLAIVGLIVRKYQLARLAAMIQVALILVGCSQALYPLLIPPVLTIAEAAAPPAVLRMLLVVLAAGSVVLLPSLVYLFRIFKSHTFSALPDKDRSELDQDAAKV